MSSRPTWDDTWIEVARTVAKRSTCARDQVGAVVVSRTNRILETGYNGPPAGWDIIHSDKCDVWCPRAVKGTMWGFKHEPDCAIVTTHHLTCTCGSYTREQEPLEPDYSDCVSLHAEQNALMFGDRAAREGGTIYVSSGVCSTCAKLIANSGLEQVVMALSTQYDAAHRQTGKWVEFMEQCGLTVVIL